MSGSGVGRAIEGYYRGRDLRESAEDREEDRKWKRNRRDRTTERESIFDPIDEEEAGLGIRRSRINTDDAEHASPINRRGLERGERMDGYREADDLFERPFNRLDTERKERLSKAEEEDYLHRRQYDRDDVERQARVATAAEEDQKFARPHERQGVLNRSRVSDLGVEESERRGVLGVMELDNVEIIRQGENAIGIFKDTGSPKALEDFYNKYYDDGVNVQIEKVSDDKYIMHYSNGEKKETDKATLIRRSEEVFVTAMRSGEGYAGMRNNRGRGRYSQEDEEQQAAREYYSDMLDKLLPGDFEFMDPQEQDIALELAKKRAYEMTNSFMRTGFGVGSGGDGFDEGQGSSGIRAPRNGRMGDVGRVDTSHIPPGAIEKLRSNPGLAQAFEQKYDLPSGAAEAILNGN